METQIYYIQVEYFKTFFQNGWPSSVEQIH